MAGDHFRLLLQLGPIQKHFGQLETCDTNHDGLWDEGSEASDWDGKDAHLQGPFYHCLAGKHKPISLGSAPEEAQSGVAARDLLALWETTKRERRQANDEINVQ